MSSDEQLKPSPTTVKTRPKQENALLSLVFNIALPVLVLTKLSAENRLGATNGFLLAMALPLAYGIYDFNLRRKFNLIAALGFMNILIKGSLGFFKLDGLWFAINEAALPTLIGTTFFFLRQYKPTKVYTLMINENLLQVERIHKVLDEKRLSHEFKQVVQTGAGFVILSFLVSAVLNFFLAVYYLKSPSGTEAFNAELGTMTAMSYPIIMVSSTAVLFFAIYYIAKKLRTMTGLEWDEILIQK